MSVDLPLELHLATTWSPATDTSPATYTLQLTNTSSDVISQFRLHVSGPASIDPASQVTGGTIGTCLANSCELLPPESLSLATGESWVVSIREMPWPLRHWTDGARGAYVVRRDGRTRPVTVGPTRLTGSDSMPLRGAAVPPVAAQPPVAWSIVPWPNEVSLAGRRTNPPSFSLQATHPEAVAASAAFAKLTDVLFPDEGMVSQHAAYVADADAADPVPVQLVVVDDMTEESYRVTFHADGVGVSAASSVGLLYGLITLGQIWRGARHHPETLQFPVDGEIADAPHMAWRGVHLDVARQFYDKSEIEQFLAIAAWNKLNRFHWHLSDDEAWRVQIDAYPSLTEVGTWRGHDLPIPALLGSGSQPSGGFYTKDDIRTIVSLAAQYGIGVVPEIDIPGHCFAMLQSLPQLRDPDEHGSYASIQGFPNNCLNPAMEATYEVVETVLAELIPLFPLNTIHIGADEVPLAAWSGSPIAMAKLRELAGDDLARVHALRLAQASHPHSADDIDGSGAAVLQAMFLKRVHEFLASRGCTTGGWQEAAHGDAIDTRTSYLCGWRSVDDSAALADRGYKIVVCPGQVYYLDMATSRAWDEPGGSWAGWADTEKVYRFDPVAGWTDKQLRQFLGIQACIWSESMMDRAVFHRLVFPRISAIAETAWTEPSQKSWERFVAVVGLMPTPSRQPD